jgi:ATP-dependent Clp protease ATP-binding subunit ClpC
MIELGEAFFRETSPTDARLPAMAYIDGMFERFTDAARRVLFIARYQAEELGNSCIGPEHLLLGILEEPRGVTEQLIRDAKVSASDLRQTLLAGLSGPRTVEPPTELALSSAAQTILHTAVREADDLQQQVRQEHILLGILQAEPSSAASLLPNHGIDVAAIRKAIRSRSLRAEGTAPSSIDSATARRFTVARIEITDLDVADIDGRIDRIQELLRQLASVVPAGEIGVFGELEEQLQALKKLF